MSVLLLSSKCSYIFWKSPFDSYVICLHFLPVSDLSCILLSILYKASFKLRWSLLSIFSFITLLVFPKSLPNPKLQIFWILQFLFLHVDQQSIWNGFCVLTFRSTIHYCVWFDYYKGLRCFVFLFVCSFLIIIASFFEMIIHFLLNSFDTCQNSFLVLDRRKKNKQRKS